MKKMSIYEFVISVTKYITSDDIHTLMKLAINDGFVSDWCVFKNAETQRKISATGATKILLGNGELVLTGKDGRQSLILIQDILRGIMKFIELGYDSNNIFDRHPYGGKNYTELLTKTEVNHIIHLAAFGKPFCL